MVGFFVKSFCWRRLCGCCLCVFCLLCWGSYRGLVGSVVPWRCDFWRRAALWRGFIWCEGDYSSLEVVSILVYQDAAPGVFGYPLRGSSPEDV